MAVYKKKVESTDKRFADRSNYIVSGRLAAQVKVPDNITLCNGCNQNIYSGYLLYLGKRELAADRPYDFYCEGCLNKYFPKAIEVK